MKWHYINTGENSGKFNMAFDLLLAKNCRRDEAYLRFYRWNPYCISLGANQNVSSLNSGKAYSNNIDIVVRPTGGRAILHSEELTYSVVLPVDQTSSVKNIYQEINLALAAGLKIFDPLLGEVELESVQPDFPSFYKQEKSFACFAVPAKSELKFAGKKLVGSAQRKLSGVILQHGSILCGSFHKNIIDYLITSEENYSGLKKEMDDSTIDLNFILNKKINYSNLAESLLSGFEKHFQCTFENLHYDEIPGYAGLIESEVTADAG